MYEITEERQERLDNNFTYHSPNESQQERYPQLRSEGKALAETICRLTPGSREQSLALTKLEESYNVGKCGNCPKRIIGVYDAKDTLRLRILRTVNRCFAFFYVLFCSWCAW